MALFQKTVEQKYLKQLDAELINAKYREFKAYFGNPNIQENIRNSKEEQYQGEFLIDLFVNILGYVKNPAPNFNLTTEYKNVKDSKKADGAIIINDSVKAVIELKGTNTTDLNKIETQAFGYKNNQPDCLYVVTSNFEKLRFYIDNAIEHIGFNLFTLTKPEFEILYLCLSFESIKNGLPKKVKDESLSQEDVITRKLYQDYSLFKRGLHQNLVSLNPQYDSLTLFRKSQKLLDRFLFLFFAEDRNLLPPNSVRLILNDWRDLQERDVEIPLYQRFKKYFEYLNTGFKGKRYDVFAYNGGLFKPDEVLDSILIDDELLFKHTSKLSEYDFVSEVDVNILGHIFENSLNELDEINAQLAGEEIDKTKTRRKKDGVFYTPKYITKYIVENTVGKLCTEKKAELQIVEEEYATDKRRQLKTKQALLDKLKTYQTWLLQLTICDPACGSGAFLNQALDFLITEHRTIDELQAKLLGVPIIFSDIEKSILENNLFGVDLNEESVEIAKLSLWLRTAQPNRKLNDLNNNIKCGNSLISDPAIAGDKAFDWEREFPQVFGRKEIETPLIEVPKDKTPDYLKLIKEKSLEAQSKAEQALALSKEAADLSKKVYEYAEKLDAFSEDDSIYGINKGGFDVVIGNPPYVQLQSMGEMSDMLSKCGYLTYNKSADLYCLFYERGCQLLKPKGYLSYITSNKWLRVNYGVSLRKFLTTKVNPIILIDFPGIPVFADAVVDPHILVLTKQPYQGKTEACAIKTNTTDLETVFEANKTTKEFSSESWTIVSIDDAGKLEQMKLNGTKLKNLPISINYGIKTGFNDAFYIDDYTRIKLIAYDDKSAELIKPMVRGRDISPYHITGFEHLICTFPSLKLDIENYRAIKEHLLSFGYDRLKQTGDNGARKKTSGKWFETQDSISYHAEFAKPKIIYPNMTSVFPFMYDESGMLGNDKSFILTAQDDSVSLMFLTAVFNSSLAKLWIWWNCPELGDNRREIRKIYFEHFPVPQANEEQTVTLTQYAKERAQLTASLQTICSKFTRSIQREFNLEKLSAKLENWFQIPFNEFLKELEKSKVKLKLSQKVEWEEYFMQESKKALDIKHQIDATDKEIDQMVYSLYGLSEEEIKIVEGN
jgi:type I restriction-modification system DNA methylase subunit